MHSCSTRRMRLNSGWGSLGDGRGKGGSDGSSWCWGEECRIGSTPGLTGVEGGQVEGGSDFVAVGFFLASRVSVVNRLSFLNPLIASETRST